MPNHVNNKVLGAGKLYLALEDTAGKLQGERYLGDTPGFTLSVATESVEDFTSDSAVAEKDVDTVTQVTRSGAITAKDVSLDNLALFALGEVKAITQSGTQISGEAHDSVEQDRWYQIGVTTTNPVGARNVSAVAVKDDQATPTTFIEDTDYELDAAQARIYVIPGGGITTGTNLVVGATPAAADWSRVETGGVKALYGALHFIADNTIGENRDLYGPRTQLQPGGDFALKSRDTIAQMEFSVEFLKSGRGEALYVDGRPA